LPGALTSARTTGTSKEDAMQQYIDEVKRQQTEYGA
jgi:acyl-CoA-binding protein